jgi:hypothetical protein
MVFSLYDATVANYLQILGAVGGFLEKSGIPPITPPCPFPAAAPSAPIDRALTFVREHRKLVSHLDESHFEQRSEIARTDRRKLCPLAFDIAQRPAEADRGIERQGCQRQFRGLFNFNCWIRFWFEYFAGRVDGRLTIKGVGPNRLGDEPLSFLHCRRNWIVIGQDFSFAFGPAARPHLSLRVLCAPVHDRIGVKFFAVRPPHILNCMALAQCARCPERIVHGRLQSCPFLLGITILEIANMPVLSFAHFCSPFKNAFSRKRSARSFSTQQAAESLSRSHFALRLHPPPHNAVACLITSGGTAM